MKNYRFGKRNNTKKSKTDFLILSNYKKSLTQDKRYDRLPRRIVEIRSGIPFDVISSTILKNLSILRFIAEINIADRATQEKSKK